MNNVVSLRVMESYKCGDIVMLKSGGPLMTVRLVTGKGYGTIKVDWFTEGEHMHGEFLSDELVHFEEVIEEDDSP